MIAIVVHNDEASWEKLALLEFDLAGAGQAPDHDQAGS